MDSTWQVRLLFGWFKKMNERPDVSVVMSVYNGAAHLRETIDSILNQKGVLLEFVIVNDGSTDQSPQILYEYAEREPRVRIIHQENQGLTRALIAGCAAATGDYIARQDVGDISLPGRLLLQKSTLDRNDDVVYVSCWSEYCGPEWEFLYVVKGTGRAGLPAHIIDLTETHGVMDGPTCHPSVMFRRESYLKGGGYRAEFYCGQDWDLWYRLAELGKFQVIEQSLYRVRILPTGISIRNRKIQQSLARLSYEALLQRSRSQSDQNILEQACQIRPVSSKANKKTNQAAGLYFIGECLRRRNDQASITYFQKAIRQSPLSIKPWIRLIQCKINQGLKVVSRQHTSAS
ncbi:MAG: glycosyltransferase family 2 protein [Blastocatellia bacterium]